jgi:5-phospho-D-xylono-1,4-lactonase
MAVIQTVLGSIAPEQLGITYGHEHLLFCPPPPYDLQDPDLRLDSIETAIQEVQHFKAAGGQSIIEMGTVEMGRSPKGLKAISQAAGVHIIAATGFNKDLYCGSLVQDQSVKRLAAQMVRDLTIGIDDTDIRAGLIKFSTSLNTITTAEEKIVHAAILAHDQTGAPISTHTEAGTLALTQVRRLTSAGVDTGRVTIGHLDRNLDWDMLKAVADTGVFMGFDQISKEKYFPDSVRIDMIRRLIEGGYGKQILLAGDQARKSSWPSYGFGCGPGLTYILWRFVPWMLSMGISKAAVDDMLINNPARAFSWY